MSKATESALCPICEHPHAMRDPHVWGKADGHVTVTPKVEPTPIRHVTVTAATKDAPARHVTVTPEIEQLRNEIAELKARVDALERPMTPTERQRKRRANKGPA